MRIYKMTATFGKLEQATLTLEPGLNVIQAPNEWGKSTWCAFLASMLYGVDTRAKTTKTALADKQRYAPWSGSPMAGSMDLEWNGRRITIERRTKGRIPMGEFRAFETDTGLDIPELTADNCGQQLLGVEQTVFRRAGFIRLAEMPVTRDDALMHRLNALVTTGDESGDAERLMKELRDLKNRCRYHRTGLLPQAEEEREILEGKLQEREALQSQSRKLKLRLEETDSWIRQLENHKTALEYAAAEENARRIAESRDAWAQAEKALMDAEQKCVHLPSREDTERKLREVRAFRDQWNNALMDLRFLPKEPEAPEAALVFRDMTGAQAENMVREDMEAYAAAANEKVLRPLATLMILMLAAGIGLFFWNVYTGAAALGLAVILFALFLNRRGKMRRRTKGFVEKYGSADTAQWLRQAWAHGEALEAYRQALEEYRSTRGDLEIRVTFLQKQRDSLCGGQEPEAVLEIWQQAMDKWDAYYAACREEQQARKHLEALKAMAKPAPKPAMTDILAYSREDTHRLLQDAQADRQHLLGRIGQYQGRMDALGEEAEIQNQLAAVQERIRKLEEIYEATELAMDTLTQAKRELQRRFAPRIAARAQQLMKRLTLGRYGRLTLGNDLEILAGAGEEETLREALWRSDGTVDQLYLALRLAVAEELTPKSPLVLDDALARFDDQRLRAAMEILKEMANTRQVLLFSCQSREENILS